MKKFSFKKSGKRALSLVLAACMSLGLAVTGCGSKKKDIITLTVFSQRANYQGELVGWSAQVLEEKFNVKLNLVDGSQFDVRLASGDLGDILVLGEGEFRQAAENNALFDWEEDNLLDEYGENIKEYMQDGLNKARLLAPDGKCYGMPNEATTEKGEALQSFFYTWDIRWDLYEELGRPAVNTLDDMLELFKKMKEICPTDDAGNPTYAVSMWPDWDGDMVMYVKSMATSYFGYEGDQGLGHYDSQTGEFYGALEDNSPYLQMLKFFNKMYQAGLVDESSMTQKYDNAIEKVKKSGVFFSIFNYSGRQAYNTADHLNEGKMMNSFTPADAHPAVYAQNTGGAGNWWAIGAQSANPEAAMEIINWLSTAEGQLTSLYGPMDEDGNGGCWYFDEENKVCFTEVGEACAADKNTQMIGDYEGSQYKSGEMQINCLVWNSDCPVLGGYVDDATGFKESYNKESWISYQNESKYEIGKKWAEFTGCQTVNEYMLKTDYRVIHAKGDYTAEKQSKELKTKWKAVTKAIVNGSWKAIYAKTDAEYDKVVADMIKEAKGAGYDECLEWSIKEAEARHECELAYLEEHKE